MKALLAIIALAATTNAFAISRYYSKNYTCSELKQIVKNEGAVILRYPSTRVPGLMLYDRYVKHNGYCYSGDEATRSSAPSSDMSKCRLYVCKPNQHGR